MKLKQGQRLPGTPAPTHQWTGWRGVKLAGDSWGRTQDPVVLLLHGGGQTRHAWGGTGKLLAAAGYHVIALDARGHGDSQWAPDGDYAEETMSRDLEAVVAELGAPRPALVGASLGGIASLMAAGEGRVDAGAVVLVDVVPRTEPAGSSRVQQFMQQGQEGFESLEAVSEAIGRYRPQGGRPRNLAGLAKNVRIGDDGRYRWHWDPRFLDGRAEMIRHRAERLSACARTLTAPALLVRGAGSDVVTEEGAREFLAMCPRAEYVSVAGAGHMVTGDRNDVFGQAVIDFLARCRLGLAAHRPGGTR